MATYYVDGAGLGGVCNDANPGTAAQPWCTIQKAATTMVAGDTTYIRAHTYTEQVIPANSGGAGNYITYQAYPGESPIIDANGLDLRPDFLCGIFWINTKNYIKVIGLHVKNTAGGFALGGWCGFCVDTASYIEIMACSSYNTDSSGIYVRDSDHITVDGNEVRRAVNGGTQECISIVSVSYFEVKNNTVHDGVGLAIGGEGIDTKGKCFFGSVYNNHVYDLPLEVGIYIDARSYVPPGDYMHDLQIYNNLVSTPVGIALATETGGDMAGIKVYNNIVHEGEFYGIVIYTYAGNEINVEICNNTVFDYGDTGILIADVNVTNLIVNNNILSENDAQQLAVVAGALGQTSANNNVIHFFLGGPNEIKGNNPVEADPEFVNKVGGDFHLASNSPAIDAGTPVAAAPFDYDGKGRPVGAGYDIGAYEYGTDAPSPTPTPIPTPTPAPRRRTIPSYWTV